MVFYKRKCPKYDESRLISRDDPPISLSFLPNKENPEGLFSIFFHTDNHLPSSAQIMHIKLTQIHPIRISPAQRRHQSFSSVGWMTPWFTEGSVRTSDLCTVPILGEWRLTLSDLDFLSLFQKDPPGSYIGFRSIFFWRQLFHCWFSGFQVDGQMNEPQRPGNSRQSLCFFWRKGSNETHDHFWADSCKS